MPEPFTVSSGTSVAASPVVGGRRRSHKKLRLVKKKTVRKMLAAKGLKMRGGGEMTGSEGASMGGRRHRKSHKKTHRRRRSLFGMKY